MNMKQEKEKVENQKSIKKTLKPSKQKRMTKENELFRDAKEHWIWDLQTQFIETQELLEQLLEFKRQNKDYDQQFRRQFQKKVKEDIASADKIIEMLKQNKVNEDDEDFSANPATRHIKVSFQDALEDLRNLIFQIYQIEIQEEVLRQFKLPPKREIRSQPLLTEISNSNKRVQRLQAGNRLTKVLQEQLNQLDNSDQIQKNNQESIDNLSQNEKLNSQDIDQEQNQNQMKQSKKVHKISQNYSQMQIKTQPIQQNNFTNNYQQLNKNTLKVQDHQKGPEKIKNLQQINKKGQNIKQHLPTQSSMIKIDTQETIVSQFNSRMTEKYDIQLKEFKNKKQYIYDLINQYVQISCQDPNFEKKYKNLYLYFKDRYELLDIYVGDSSLKNYVNSDPKINRMELNVQQNEEKSNLHLQIQEMDRILLHEINNLDEKNPDVIKIAQLINDSIKEKLIQDDHKKKMEQIKNLQEVEANRQLHKKMELAQTNGGLNQTYIKAKNLQLKQENDDQTQSYYQIMQNKITLSEKALTNKRNFFTTNQKYKKIQNLFLNAHPDNKIEFQQDQPYFNNYANQKNENYQQLFQEITTNDEINQLNFKQENKIKQQNLKTITKNSSLPQLQLPINHEENFKLTYQENMYFNKTNKNNKNSTNQDHTLTESQRQKQKLQKAPKFLANQQYSDQNNVQIAMDFKTFSQTQKEKFLIPKSNKQKIDFKLKQLLNKNTRNSSKDINSDSVADQWCLYLSKYGTSKYRVMTKNSLQNFEIEKNLATTNNESNNMKSSSNKQQIEDIDNYQTTTQNYDQSAVVQNTNKDILYRQSGTIWTNNF